MGDHTNWSEEEFKAYLCLYAAESNFEIHAEEKRLIDSKFSPETIEKIKEETDDLNDYQRSQIIIFPTTLSRWFVVLSKWDRYGVGNEVF